MSDKILNFKDTIDIEDKIIISSDKGGPKGSRILFIDDETGKPYREEHNKQVIAGSQFTAMRQFGLKPAVKFPNYNQELGIDPTDMGLDNNDITCLFCCGNGGCGNEADQVYPVKFASRIHPKDLVPFRYQQMDDDLTAAQREIYFGRKEIPEDNRIAYYFKAFDSIPQLHPKFIDGTQIGSDVYELATSMRATYYVEVKLKITRSDLRDFYLATDKLGNARINQISLLTAHVEEGTDGFKYYKNIQPLTQLNFTNEWLVDLNKSITILYQIFY